MPTIAHITADRVKPLDGLKLPVNSQIRTRPAPLTEDDKAAIRRATGSSPYLDVKFVPVSKGRSRAQTRRNK